MNASDAMCAKMIIRRKEVCKRKFIFLSLVAKKENYILIDIDDEYYSLSVRFELKYVETFPVTSKTV